jgi:hypothetical protein
MPQKYCFEEITVTKNVGKQFSIFFAMWNETSVAELKLQYFLNLDIL